MEQETVACERCTKVLQRGDGTAYVVTLVATCDPTMTAPDAQSVEDIRAEIRRTLAALDDVSAKEANDSVQRQRQAWLCRGCVTEWFNEPFGMGSA